jgi:hypothetical protein
MQTLIGFFETMDAADGGVKHLFAQGVAREDISLLSNMREGTNVADEPVKDDQEPVEQPRRRGVLVMVVVNDESRIEKVRSMLLETGAEELQSHDVEWRRGGWEPFDPYTESPDTPWRQSSKAGTVAGGVVGAAAGAALGSVGGPLGAVAGGVAGAAAGAALGAGGDTAGQELKKAQQRGKADDEQTQTEQ